MLIDYFDGEPVPATAVFTPHGVEGFDIASWLQRHPAPRALEVVRAVAAALKTEGATRFGATGYCYGGRLCFDMGFENEIHVAAMAHPSLLKYPEDFQVRASQREKDGQTEDGALIPGRNTPRRRRRRS